MAHLPLVLLALCLGSIPDPAAAGGAAPPAPAEPGTVRYEDAAGKPVLKIKVRDDGFRLYDGADAVAGKAKVFPDRVKLSNAGDVERWKIKKKEYGAEIETAAGQRVFRIKAEAGGQWKLVDDKDALVAACKPKDAGFEVRDASGRTFAKVKVRDGRLVLEDEAGARLGVLQGTTNAKAGMWFAVPSFSPIEKGALYAYFESVGK